MRLSFYLLTIFSGIGIWLSDQLVKIHAQTHFAGAGDTGVCAGEGMSCADVAASAWSSIGDLPIASIGEAWYAVIIILAGIMRFRPELLKRAPDVLFFGAVGGVIYSIVLGVVSKVVIGKLCPFCLGLYAVNLGLFITMIFTLPRGVKATLKGALSLPKAKATWVTVALMVAGLMVAQGVHAKLAAKEKAHYDAVQQNLKNVTPAHFQIDVRPEEARGRPTAPVVVVEYSDFQCPFCSVLYRSLKEISKSHPDLVQYHFRHYPMSFHKYAMGAAIAAECARDQGQFWPMHDLLFENQKRLTDTHLKGYAERLSLDLDRFEVCQDDKAIFQRVKTQHAEGKALGVNGTPTFFVNGWRIVGAKRPEHLLRLLKQAEARAKKKAAKHAAAK